MHGLLPIIRRVRRPLLPVEEARPLQEPPHHPAAAAGEPPDALPPFGVPPSGGSATGPAEAVKPARPSKRALRSPQGEAPRAEPEQSHG